MAFQGNETWNTPTDPHRLDRYTDSQQQGIRDAWAAHQNDPATLKKLMADTGVSAQTIGYAVGMDPYEVNSIVNPPTIYTSAQRGQTQPGDGRDWIGMMEDAGWANRAPAPSGTGAQPGGGMGGAGNAGGGMGGGASSSAGGGMSTTGQNPYLQQMGDALTSTMTNNWRRNVQPQIASSAMATGGYGGSRQGVMEANSANDLNQGIGSALAGLYGNGYNTALNYDLGMTNANNSYDLGVKNNQLGFGNLGLGYANLDRNINNDNNSWQLQGANFGMGVYNQMQQNNQAGIQSGTNIQNTPMNYWSQFGNQANSFGQGYGTTTGSTSQQGSPFMGALGGAQLGQQVGNWWSGGTAGSAGDTATGQNFWAPNFSGGMGD